MAKDAQRVVVLGGGYAGVEAAKSMDKMFDVTLVTGRDTFLHDIGGMRASCVPGYHEKILIPYDNLLKRGKVLHCPATRIDAEACTVSVSTGEVIPYDFLILATGAMHPKTVGHAGGKPTDAERVSVFSQAYTEIAAASDILILGGGPIGIEMAGEIKEVFPEKSVKLVTSKELMPSVGADYPVKLRKNLETKLASVGVDVATNAGRVAFDMAAVNECGFIPGKQVFKWTGGEMQADLCVVAIGATQASPIYADSGLEGWLNDKGMVQVERTLEVKGASSGGGKVFAVGDCIDLPIPKMARLAGPMGGSIYRNVVASAAGKPLKELAPPAPEAIAVVPVGSKGGVSALPMGLVLGDFLTRNIKSKDLLAGRFWATLNAGKPPATTLKSA